MPKRLSVGIFCRRGKTTRTKERLDRELTTYTNSLIEGMGRPERWQAMADYVTGLLLDGDRKSIEPMAGRLVAGGHVEEEEGASYRTPEGLRGVAQEAVEEWEEARAGTSRR